MFYTMCQMMNRINIIPILKHNIQTFIGFSNCAFLVRNSFTVHFNLLASISILFLTIKRYLWNTCSMMSQSSAWQLGILMELYTQLHCALKTFSLKHFKVVESFLSYQTIYTLRQKFKETDIHHSTSHNGLTWQVTDSVKWIGIAKKVNGLPNIIRLYCNIRRTCISDNLFYIYIIICTKKKLWTFYLCYRYKQYIQMKIPNLKHQIGYKLLVWNQITAL